MTETEVQSFIMCPNQTSREAEVGGEPGVRLDYGMKPGKCPRRWQLSPGNRVHSQGKGQGHLLGKLQSQGVKEIAQKAISGFKPGAQTRTDCCR